MIKTKTMLSGVLTLKEGTYKQFEDTKFGMYATMAVADFKAGNRIKLVGHQSATLIPYHSIAVLAITKTVTSSEITDDFCPVPGEGGGGDDDPK